VLPAEGLAWSYTPHDSIIVYVNTLHVVSVTPAVSQKGWHGLNNLVRICTRSGTLSTGLWNLTLPALSATHFLRTSVNLLPVCQNKRFPYWSLGC